MQCTHHQPGLVVLKIYVYQVGNYLFYQQVNKLVISAMFFIHIFKIMYPIQLHVITFTQFTYSSGLKYLLFIEQLNF